MPGNRKVSVIIPTWKRGDLLRRCLQSLRRQSFCDYEVVLVSNGAGEWAESVAREFGCRLVSFAANRGFAAAVNAGLAASQSPLVLILNDDAELDPAWLEKTVAELEEHQAISLCCGKILKPDGRTVDDAGGALAMGGGAWRLGHGRADGPAFAHRRFLFAVSLTAALFRRSVFEQAGTLDERFVSYLEDVDFSIRLWRAGLRGAYVPQAVAWHRGGGSLGEDSPERFRLMTRNQLFLLAKHYPASFRLAGRALWAQILWLGMAVRKRRFTAYLAGAGQCLGLLCASFLGQGIRSRKEGRQKQRRAFLEWLRVSERAIYEDIQARPRPEQDAYWRLYFSLFPPHPRPVQPAGAAAEPGASPPLGAPLP
ncbi:MAG TPA: glycosyltransferase family 2 protein [Terriglobia bacterium]|nr:glycosyltransferase family 2 protein [Terriglobia bacterium]